MPSQNHLGEINISPPFLRASLARDGMPKRLNCKCIGVEPLSNTSSDIFNGLPKKKKRK